MFVRGVLAELLFEFGIICACIALFAWIVTREEHIDVEDRIGSYAPSLPVRRHVGVMFCTSCLHAHKSHCTCKHRSITAASRACRFYERKSGAA